MNRVLYFFFMRRWFFLPAKSVIYLESKFL